MSSLLNQPTGLLADPREAWLANLLDPRVGHRSAILPLVEVGGDDTGRGSVEFGAPQFLVDMLKSAMLPGAVAQGYQPAPEEVTQMAMDTMLGGGLLGRAPSGALGMNLWHGGPHRWAAEPDFPHGRPRLDKMGTGEGAQAYGHGFYSAEAKGVADDYRRTLALEPEEKLNRLVDVFHGEMVNGEPVTLSAIKQEMRRSTNPLIRDLAQNDEWAGLIHRAAKGRNPDGSDGADSLAAYRAMSDKLKAQGVTDGTLYKLDLPDEDVAKYLDWDAPLSEQPEAVLSALKEYNPMAINARNPEWELHQMVRSKRGAEILKKHGVPGLKYFDGNSRHLWDVQPYGDAYRVVDPSGKGPVFKTKAEAQKYALEHGDRTRNYVTWDQDVLDRSKILERDGEALND